MQCITDIYYKYRKREVGKLKISIGNIPIGSELEIIINP
jgi:hypothetical protein